MPLELPSFQECKHSRCKSNESSSLLNWFYWEMLPAFVEYVEHHWYHQIFHCQSIHCRPVQFEGKKTIFQGTETMPKDAIICSQMVWQTKYCILRLSICCFLWTWRVHALRSDSSRHHIYRYSRCHPPGHMLFLYSGFQVTEHCIPLSSFVFYVLRERIPQWGTDVDFVTI